MNHPNPVSPISPERYRARREQLLALPELANDHVGFVWWGNAYIFYLTGFAFVPTERPIALLINREGKTVLFVPRLEVEHVQAYAHVDEVRSYPEYPDVQHPLEQLTEIMAELAMQGGRFYGDGDGYGQIMGYRGPALSSLSKGSFHNAVSLLDSIMYVKTDDEIALIRASAYWASYAHRLLQDYTAPGLSESEVEMRAAFEAGQALREAYGGTYRALSWGGTGPHAGYRGQIGAHGAMPHSLNINAVFQAGDTLVTGASCPMFGYYSELERTMVLGEPSAQQRYYFEHMLALQDLAIDACRAGQPCSSVDQKVRAYFEKHDLLAHWRHHVGHNIGVRYHEGPFLDIGDHTIMEPGMLFTVEPGLYVPGLGGFRHSDTIVVTEGEPEFLTLYPRDLDSLTLPV